MCPLFSLSNQLFIIILSILFISFISYSPPTETKYESIVINDKKNNENDKISLLKLEIEKLKLEIEYKKLKNKKISLPSNTESPSDNDN